MVSFGELANQGEEQRRVFDILEEFVVCGGGKREGKESVSAEKRKGEEKRGWEGRRQTVRLEELDDRPDSDVLEGLVGRAEEADEVKVKTALGLGPDTVEGSVVVGGCKGQDEELESESVKSVEASQGKTPEREIEMYLLTTGFRWRQQSFPGLRRRESW